MDEPKRSRRWLLVLPVMASLVAVAWAARGQVERWTRQRLSDSYRTRIQSLPERQAAALVRQLSELDADAPAVLVPLLADGRDAVAHAADETLHRLVADWRRLPSEQSTPRVAALARELANIAPRLPSERQSAARQLAARLLDENFESYADNHAGVVADCETVLCLRPPVESELRIATAPSRPKPLLAQPLPPEAATTPVPAEPQLPAVVAAPSPVPTRQPPPVEHSFYGRPREPERLIDASRERPEEPRQLRRPRAMKIEG